ncbi:MAG: hypothetical protein GX144_04710 [Clostridiaceae bacterium]|jgi:hypothetical protein|nr:hypothetical protein [Clostridiaceae bacterium]
MKSFEAGWIYEAGGFSVLRYPSTLPAIETSAPENNIAAKEENGTPQHAATNIEAHAANWGTIAFIIWKGDYASKFFTNVVIIIPDSPSSKPTMVGNFFN